MVLSLTFGDIWCVYYLDVSELLLYKLQLDQNGFM